MRRADQISGALLLVFGAGFTVGAGRYPYWTPAGPGSGFLPFWLGLAMAGLAAMLLVGATRRPDAGPAWLPGGRALVRLGVAIATASVNWLVFAHWLHVPFPIRVLGF